ncbi:hypothetical protein B296_00042451 [Ensete ventricosum]|uniref:Uncharacterized protein n=1 Tax=Ensete ventricosum TaxID=4639 RepID=A0A426Y1Q1_ENSVE|nr:hypothetical protein B296_00042451 [Ensete ventricosum]
MRSASVSTECKRFYSECCKSFIPDILTVLLFTMLSHLSTTPAVLAMKRAPAGEGCRPYLCQVGYTIIDAPIPALDRLPASGRPHWRVNCPRARELDGQLNIYHINTFKY